MVLKEGDLAPDFTLVSDEGEDVTLSSFRGGTVVVYFYPKDDTPGCAKEACSFRDANSLFMAKGATVIGISPDDAKSHQSFRVKHGLPFYLLSDTDHCVAEAYGAWGEKRMYGRTYEGIIRSTFVVGEDGRILKAFPKVKPDDHATEVLAYL